MRVQLLRGTETDSADWGKRHAVMAMQKSTFRWRTRGWWGDHLVVQIGDLVYRFHLVGVA